MMKIIPHIRNVVVLRETNVRHVKDNNNLLRLMVCNEPFTSFIFGCFSDASGFCRAADTIAIPQQWPIPDVTRRFTVVRYDQTIPVNSAVISRNNSWIVVSDGRFVPKTDEQKIPQLLAETTADVVAVNVVPQLRASYEKVLTASHNELVGFRLFYEDAARLTPIPDDWPHHLFVRTGSLNTLLTCGGLSLAFDKLLELCTSKSLVVQSIDLGGSVLDISEEAGLLELMCCRLGPGERSYRRSGYRFRDAGNGGDDIVIADSARLFGNILLGNGVNIAENAIIVGPAIVGNNVRIGKDAVVRASVIGPGVLVPPGSLCEQKVLTNTPAGSDRNALNAGGVSSVLIRFEGRQNSFRKWPRFSYMGLIKRIFDIVASIIVLVLFLPVLPIIMLAIKLNSPGPVFFKDTRQGLHGRPFKCLKFRTMRVDASRMQDRLRVLNQVDGPQFMIEDDPRMSTVGKFLRETYIDEILQFLNVLLGQMSVVGPRPSPESENRLCPFWRDARLSVRPGVTGLWQVYRTRQPMKDFQEWIYYDVKYVRDLSLKLDIYICWKTAKKMAAKFISQF